MSDPQRLFNPNHQPPEGYHYTRKQDGWVLESDKTRVHLSPYARQGDDWPAKPGRMQSAIYDGTAVAIVLAIILLLIKLAGG